MNDHRAAEVLLATAIDFALTPDEQATLDRHLAGCDRCRLVAAQLRRQVEVMQRIAAEDAPPRTRAAIEAAVIRPGPNQRVLILLAAALMLAVTIGGAVLVGSGILDLDWLSINPDPVPGPSASAAPDPSAPAIALPTGTLIAYNQGSGQTSSIHTVEPDGSNNRTLAEGWSPIWSPDGSSIAYACPTGAQVSHICAMASDGGQQTILIGDDYADQPQWSPSGGQILFTHNTTDSPPAWIANADGTGTRRLGEGLGSWSPDGSWIMMIRTQLPGAGSGVPVVSVIRPDGSQLRDLGEGYSAAWSPDSSQIAFMVNGALQAYDVADGTVSTLHERIPGGALIWVADDLIVIGSEAGLYVVDLRTDELTELAADLSLWPVPPVLSPDGQWLAFTASEGDSTDVYLASLAGGGVIRLTTNGVSSSPAWQPITPPASPRRQPLDYPPLTDYGARASVLVDTLTVHDFAGPVFAVVTELEAGTEVFLASGPLSNAGQDWYEVYFSGLPEDSDQFGDFTTGWVATGPTGETPDSVRFGPLTCPDVLTADLVGGMTNFARLQCLGTDPIEVSGNLYGCTDGGEPNGSGCLNLRNSETAPYSLWLYFASDFDTTGLEAWSSIVRVVGHVDDSSSADCARGLDAATDIERAWAVLECRGHFVLTDFEVIGQQ